MSAHHHRAEWQRIRRVVLERDGWRCTRCGRAGALEAHHVQHVLQGGTDDLSNLVTLCRRCHIDAHDLAPESQRRWRDLIKTVEGVTP